MGRIWVAVGLVVALLVGCGGDSSGSDDAGFPDAARYESDACAHEARGNGTRSLEFGLTAPNFVDDFGNGSRPMLMRARPTTSDEFRLYVGPGVSGDFGFYHFTDDFADETIAHIDAAGFTSEPFTWVMAGVFEDPFVIVDTIMSNGDLDTNCGARLVTGGTLIGVLTPDNASEIILTVDLDLYTALVGLGVEADVDHDGDGVNESWKVVGHFSAHPVWIWPLDAE